MNIVGTDSRLTDLEDRVSHLENGSGPSPSPSGDGYWTKAGNIIQPVTGVTQINYPTLSRTFSDETYNYAATITDDGIKLQATRKDIGSIFNFAISPLQYSLKLTIGSSVTDSVFCSPFKFAFTRINDGVTLTRTLDGRPYAGGDNVPCFNDFDSEQFEIASNKIHYKGGGGGDSYWTKVDSTIQPVSEITQIHYTILESPFEGEFESLHVQGKTTIKDDGLSCEVSIPFESSTFGYKYTLGVLGLEFRRSVKSAVATTRRIHSESSLGNTGVPCFADFDQNQFELVSNKIHYKTPTVAYYPLNQEGNLNVAPLLDIYPIDIGQNDPAEGGWCGIIFHIVGNPGWIQKWDYPNLLWQFTLKFTDGTDFRLEFKGDNNTLPPGYYLDAWEMPDTISLERESTSKMPAPVAEQNFNFKLLCAGSVCYSPD
jgi:hypothetical protein